MKNYKGVKVATDEEIKAVMSEPDKPIPVGMAIRGKDLMANMKYTEKDAEWLRGIYHCMVEDGEADWTDEEIEEKVRKDIENSK